jgi:hypothetical protein
LLSINIFVEDLSSEVNARQKQKTKTKQKMAPRGQRGMGRELRTGNLTLVKVCWSVVYRRVKEGLQKSKVFVILEDKIHYTHRTRSPKRMRA